MSTTSLDYGLLLNKDIKLHRTWFKQMTKLLGINVIYYAPLVNKSHDSRGDLVTGYAAGIPIGCIFEEHPDQKSLKKTGWVAELQENSSMIHVQYDLPNLQIGALFEIPSGLDNAPGRKFRVISMQNSIIYPAAISCELALEYDSVDESHLFNDYTENDMPLLVDNEGDD